MPVAIETVIIVIVVVSFAVLGAVVFALYWLWRLLLEDRRCNRLRAECRGTYCPQNPPVLVRPTEICVHDEGSSTAEESDRALLAHRPAGRFPQITRRSDVIVDERGRGRTGRGVRTKRERGINAVLPVRTSVVDIQEVVVIDDTEPPPPYEAMR